MFTGPETDYISGAKDNIGNGITYNSILNSSYDANKRYADKVKNISYGGKVGLRIKLGKLSQREEEPLNPIAAPRDRDTVIIYKTELQPKDTVIIYKTETRPVDKESIIKEIMDIIQEKKPVAQKEQPIVQDKKPITQEETEILFEPIYFDLNKATLKPESIKDLNRKAAILKKYPEMRLLIFGNTCNLGTDSQNSKLGLQRAEVARNYLISKGIAPERLEADTKSSYQPELPNTDEPNRMHNRRSDFEVVYP